jgi:hypothetical protein
MSSKKQIKAKAKHETALMAAMAKAVAVKAQKQEKGKQP